MKHLIAATLIFFFLSCSVEQNKLDGKTQTLELHYITWACECANWATPEDIKKYQDAGELSDLCIFIEPADSSLILSDSLGYTNDVVEFTGQYYMNKGYPEGFNNTEQEVNKANIFRYTAYKIIKSNYRETLTRLN